MRVLLIGLFILFLVPGVKTVQGQEQSNNKVVFTDSMEDDLYAAIKVEGKGFSEDAVEQAMGFGLLDSNNQWERAEKHFKKALKLNPKLYKSWYNLGLIHIDSEEGMGYFRKSIGVKPNFSTPYYWIAYYYTRYGNFKKALPIWKDYLRVAAVETATGDKGELERMSAAKEVVKEIESGKPGEELGIIHIH